MNLSGTTKTTPLLKGGEMALRKGRGMSNSKTKRLGNSPTKTIRKHIKLIAAFFMVNFLSSLFAPNIAYALTSGPVSPDYTSFEPVDTTDMVNLLSGDLAYNIPLLEVPGPAGGYPLSLSYHAGIMPNEEASWVGLGWTLNPGAISRSVNGFPDDHQNVKNTDRFFWEGGTRSQLDIGVSLGIAGISGVSAGVSIGTDTYQGFGVGGFISAEAGLGDPNSKSGLGINSKFGVDPWGNGYQSFGLSIGTEIEGLNLSAGPSTNFQSVGFGGGVSASYGQTKNGVSRGGASLVGASISSNSKGISLSVAGTSGIINNKRGNISTSSVGFTLPLPFVHLGFQQTKYWIDELESIDVNGALYYPAIEVTKEWLNDHTYDTYYAVDSEEFTVSGFPQLNGARSVGGSFPNYDHYSVTGQGISGNMQPFKFKQHLLNQNVSEGGEIIQYVTGYDSDQSFQWRFINDFSNRYEYNPTNFSGSYGKINKADFNFASNEIVGLNGEETLINGLAGSRDIKAYTNYQIQQGVSGFIENRSTGFSRSQAPLDQLGAYVITNESGISYHYSLPAYSYDEFQYSENIEKGEGHSFNTLDKAEKYAYTWHLTAITGPDFVDRGTIGKLDESDWGYWVDFQYGKWTDQYFWRNPGEGMAKDLDNNFQNFSEGTKEVYYLDAIKTKTHTAIFSKSIRDDAKSAIPILKYQNNDGKKPTDEGYNGGFTNKSITCECFTGTIMAYDRGYLTYTAKKTKSLKLDKILLVDNKYISNIPKESGSAYEQKATYSWDIDNNDNVQDAFPNLKDCDFSNLVFDQHLYKNVFDEYDLAASDFQSNAIRIIHLDNKHYDLAPGTPNSTSGKLTLKSIAFKGKGGAKIIPSMNFDYGEVLEKYSGTLQVGLSPFEIHLEDQTHNLSRGDIVNINNYTFAVINNAVPNSPVHLRILGFPLLFPQYINGKWVYFNGEKLTIEKTKNPHYLEDYYDNWGLFKSDFLLGSSENESILRRVSDESAQNVDVWSLRKVTTSIGAEIQIEYESDSFEKVATLEQNLFTVYDIEKENTSLDNNRFKITINEDKDLRNYYNVGDFISLSSIFGVNASTSQYDIEGFNDSDFKPREICNAGYINFPINVNQVEIVAVNRDDIVIHSSFMGEKLYSPVIYRRTNLYDRSYCYPTSLIANVTIYSSYFPGRFYGGYITYPNNGGIGGGIRVTSVKTINNNQSNIVNYYYSMGVTSTLPFGLIPAKTGKSVYSNTPDWQKKEHEKNLEINSYFLYSDIFKNSREIPPPGVLYGQVKIQGVINNNELPSYEIFNYETFKSGMVGYYQDFDDSDNNVEANGWYYDGKLISRQRARRTYKKDFSSRVGSLKKITKYDLNNDKIFETINHYLHDEIIYPSDENGYFNTNGSSYSTLIKNRFANQGVIEETFADARLISFYDKYDMLGVVSKKEWYPSVQTGSTTINYKTGITKTTKNLGFDFYSGQVTHSYTEDGYGNKYVTKSTPAYHYYPQMANKNMLTQEGVSYSYLMNNGFDPDNFNYDDDVKGQAVGLLGASAQSWSKYVDVIDGNTKYDDQASDKIYRKLANYSFIGDPSINQQQNGTYPISSFSEIPLGSNYQSTLLNDPDWQRNSQITLYDVNSHALEAKDINDNYAATKFDNKNERVYSTVANARYDEFAYSGAEDDLINIGSTNYFGGGVVKIGGNIRTKSEVDLVHTGQKSLRSTGTGSPFNYYLTAPEAQEKTFRASVWTTHANAQLRASVDGGSSIIGTTSESKKAGDWYLINIDFYVPSGYQQVDIITRGVSDTDVFWDDFRVHPVDATMTSYVYNEWGELSDVLDANNLYTHYEYDKMGRLKSVSRETFQYGSKKISEASIHYGGDISTTLAGTIAMDQVNYNTTKLTINFSIPGSGNYQTIWEVDGEVISGDGLSRNITLPATTSKDVIVTVTDQQTGLSFSTYDRVHFVVCEQFQLGYIVCEKENGCNTGWVREHTPNGICGYNVNRVYDPSRCETSNCQEPCPPNEICEVQQQ